MKNWKDYVAFQPYVEPTQKEDESDEEFEERICPRTDLAGVQVFVLKVKENPENPKDIKTISIAIEKQVIDLESFVYSEDEIGSAVKSVISQFPVYKNWEKFDGVDKNTWHFGFGAYQKIVDDESIIVKNYITIPWPRFAIQADYFAMRKMRKQLNIDLKTLSDEEFNRKYDNVPKDVMMDLTRDTTSFLGWGKKNIPLPYIYRESSKDKFELYSWHRVKNQIAKQSRRGPGNTRANIENLSAMYYKGNAQFDSPIIVSEYNGKYAITKHPDFEKYGFVVNGEE